MGNRELKLVLELKLKLELELGLGLGLGLGLNVAYNQPPHVSFYLGDGMQPPPWPRIVVPPPAP